MKRVGYCRKTGKQVAQALATMALLTGCWSLSQTVTAPGGVASQPDQKKAAPTFTPSGIQGNIAPSGYSGGAREDEARKVSSLIVDLQAANLADELPDAAKLSCDQQDELLQAALAQPDSFEANLRLGLFYLEHGSPGLSVKYLRLAAEKQPADAAVARYLATAAIEAEDFVDAARLTTRLIGANPADAQAHRLNGMVQAATGQTDAALAEFKLSARLNSGAGNLFSAGLAVMALGLFDEAESIYSQAISAHPDSAKLWLGQGMTELLRGNQPRAIDSLLRSAALDPADSLPPTLLASLDEIGSAIDRVLPLIQAFATARKWDAIAHYNYALVLSKSVRSASASQPWQQVESELKEAIREKPEFAAAHFQLGAACENAGDLNAAIREFSKAVSLMPNVAEWRYRLAHAYRSSGQTSLAELEMGKFKQLKSARDAGLNLSSKLLDGLPTELQGFAVDRCQAPNL